MRLALVVQHKEREGRSLFLSGTEDRRGWVRRTRISFRNLAGKGSFAVEKIDIYQWDGTVATSLTSGKFPPGFRISLGARQYTSLRLPDVIRVAPASSELQAIVSWKADAAEVVPIVTSVFLTFGKEPKTGAEKESRACHVLPFPILPACFPSRYGPIEPQKWRSCIIDFPSH